MTCQDGSAFVGLQIPELNIGVLGAAHQLGGRVAKLKNAESLVLVMKIDYAIIDFIIDLLKNRFSQESTKISRFSQESIKTKQLSFFF